MRPVRFVLLLLAGADASLAADAPPVPAVSAAVAEEAAPEELLARGRALIGDGKFAEAEPLLRDAAARFARDPAQARALGLARREHARALGFVNRIDEAEALQLLALQTLEAAAGADDPETLTAGMHLASIYAYTGRPELAEPRLRRVVNAQTAAGIKSPESVEALAGLGGALRDLGQHAEAEQLQRRALALAEELTGPDSPAVAAVLNQLAATLRHQGRHADALPFAERSLRLREQAFPPLHPNVILQRGNHAVLLGEVGRFDEAEAMLRPLMAHAAATHGRDSAYYAYYPRTFARLYHQAGRDEDARAAAEEARGIFERALAAGRREFDTDAATELPRTLAILGRIHVALGRTDDAREIVRAARPGLLAEFRRTLSYTSETQRLAFLRTSPALDLAATIGDAEALAEDSVRLRGIVFDSLVEDVALARASQDPAVAALAARHRRAMRAPPATAPDAAAGQLAELDEIERELARHGQAAGQARRALALGAADVRRALQPDEALVEFIRYRHHLPHSGSEPRYGALLVTAAAPPRWVPLGAAREIEATVARYQQLMRDGGEAAWLEQLHAAVAAPVLAALPPGIAKLRVSPDGALHGLSFAALCDAAGVFVGAQRDVSYVGSGRDLLPGKPARWTREFAIVAAPEFGTETAVAAGGGGASDRQELVRGLTLRRLPGAAREAELIGQLAAGPDRTIRRFTGADATEAQLESLHSPRWLHLATHGFFLPDLATDARRSPMQRAGLALAHAKATLAAWSDGREPDPAHDGILTAAEACGLDLAETELVVLSACDSGAGLASAGEGVLGLKRGFARAGARHLLLALWEVPDDSTPAIMADFYRALVAGAPPAPAWAATQREWLRRVAAERGPVAAARTVGPWVLNERR